VNQLVQYATGMERSTQHLKRHFFWSRHSRGGGSGCGGPWHGWFVEVGQYATDIGNWGRIQAGGAAAMLAVTGRMTLTHLKALAAIMHAKGVAAGGGALLQGLPLPPLMPLLRSAQLHMSGALAAAASVGAPGGAWAAAAAAGGGASGSAVAAGGAGGFGGFGAFASSLLLAPTSVVAAAARRPLAGGTVAAAGAGAGAVAVTGAPGADGGAAAAGRQASVTLGRASGGGSEPGPVARAREQLGRRIAGATRALQRVTGGSGSARWVLGAGSPPAGATAARPARRLAVVASAGRRSGGMSGGGNAGDTAAAPAAGLMAGFSAFSASVARATGALAAAARGRRAACPAPAPTVAPAPALASASAAVSLGPSGGDGLLCGGPSGALGDASGRRLPDGLRAALHGLEPDVGLGPGALPPPRRTRMRKSASCSSIYEGLGDCAPGTPPGAASPASLGSGSHGGSGVDLVSGLQFGSGRSSLHMPAPRLGWLRRGSSHALMLRAA
jgi:hypothetical protein